jgi:hypothetical protein
MSILLLLEPAALDWLLPGHQLSVCVQRAALHLWSWCAAQAAIRPSSRCVATCLTAAAAVTEAPVSTVGWVGELVLLLELRSCLGVL